MRSVSPHTSEPWSRRCRQRLVDLIQGTTGRWGESQAVRFLEHSDMIVLRRNWRSDRFEADIIALDKRTIVVVEVKTRHQSLQELHPAHEAVNTEKLDRLVKLGYRFVNNNGPLCRRFGLHSFRVDIIEVYYRNAALGHRVRSSLFWSRDVASVQRIKRR